MAAILVYQQEQFKQFWSTSHSEPSYQVSTGILVQKKKRKIDFQDGRHAAILDFRS